MFRGLTALNLDTKGRLAIPTRYREQLQNLSAGRLIVTIDTEQCCLLLYPFNEWQVIEAKLAELPSFNAVARRVQRLLIGHATELELDVNGRFLFPAVLRDYAKLQKKVMLVGQANKFEIWSDKLWQKGRDAWLSEFLVDGDVLPLELEQLSL
jgi:MraZ protein